MTILKRLTVVSGTYEKDGVTKKRYKTIGHVHKGKFGEYITLDASVNLAAFPRKDGDDRVMVNLYDEKDGGDWKESREPRAATEPGLDDDPEMPF